MTYLRAVTHPPPTAAPRPSAATADVPAYVLGGFEAGLAVVRALGRAGVRVISVVSSPGEMAHRSRFVETSVHVPDPADEPRAYVDRLVELADQGGGVLIPTTDESLEVVAAHHEELGGRYLLACPPQATARLFLDKEDTSAVALTASVDAPSTASPRTGQELDELIEKLRYPCLVKPRESFRYSRAFGVKMHRVEDDHQLREAWHRAHDLGLETVVQELIPGPDTGGVNYNVYMAGGQPLVEFTSRKVRLFPPHFGYPSAVVSASVPEVVDPGRAIVREMGIEGFANVEFKHDERDDRYKLMEVNGRHNMSGALAVRCGVDFPLLTYRHLVAGVAPAAGEAREGVYWINDGTDPRFVVQAWRRGDISLREGLRAYTSRHVFSTLAMDDPWPTVRRLGGKVKALLRKRAESPSGRPPL